VAKENIRCQEIKRLEKDSKTTENQKKNLSRPGENYLNQEKYTKVKKKCHDQEKFIKTKKVQSKGFR
jgi:hypothetical protein